MSQATAEKESHSKTDYTPDEIEAMETDALLLLYKQTDDENLKWPLVLRYESLIRSIALQISGVYASFAQVDDIINEGVITLMDSVDKFDLSKDVKFETFVSKRIRGMIIDLARRQDWLPRSVRRRSREIDAAVTELYGELGRHPTDDEVSSRLGISRAKYREDLINVNLCNVMSLESLFESRDSSHSEIGLPTSDASSLPEQRLQEEEFREKLAEGIRTLRENEQLVLSLYYQQEFNMREIAQVMEISEPRVSQIHSKAVQRLRVFLEHYLQAEI